MHRGQQLKRQQRLVTFDWRQRLFISSCSINCSFRGTTARLHQRDAMCSTKQQRARLLSVLIKYAAAEKHIGFVAVNRVY